MPEVRQSSFALLGDLTKACFQHVLSCLRMINQATRYLNSNFIYPYFLRSRIPSNSWTKLKS